MSYGIRDWFKDAVTNGRRVLGEPVPMEEVGETNWPTDMEIVQDILYKTPTYFKDVLRQWQMDDDDNRSFARIRANIRIIIHYKFRARYVNYPPDYARHKADDICNIIEKIIH